MDTTPDLDARFSRLWLQEDPKLSVMEIKQLMKRSKAWMDWTIGRLNLPRRPSPILRDRPPKPVRVYRSGVTTIEGLLPPKVDYRTPPPIRPPDHCQWITGQSRRMAIFCPKDCVEGSSYCTEHHELTRFKR